MPVCYTDVVLVSEKALLYIVLCFHIYNED